MVRKVIVAILAVGASLIVTLDLTSGAAPGVAFADEAVTSRINGSINIEAGEHTGDLSTVNGSIHVGAGAVVGHVNTVNGGLSLDSRAMASQLTTVNGSIDVGNGGRVQGSVHSVNGSLHVDSAGDVAGDIGNVNGNIHIAAAHVTGSIDTTSGSMDLGPNAHIDGDVLMREDTGWHFGFQSIPHVTIEPGTVVKGKLRFERKVILFVSDRATIGPVQGAEVKKFSGDHPPE
jgi:hypothetical protein